MSGADWAEKIAIDILGACSCHEAYASRGMIAPDCVWHDCSEELIAALRKARRIGLDAALAEVEPFIERTNADVAHAIANRIKSLIDQEPNP